MSVAPLFAAPSTLPSAASAAPVLSPVNAPGAPGRLRLAAERPAPQRPADEPPSAAVHFARTKIQPPSVRSGVQIERAALQEALGAALLGQRLVLVCAAAGFGKTAVLARQVQRLPAGTALAWLSIDEGDDLPRLLAGLVAALEPYDPPWRTAPEALVAAADDAGRAADIAAELINTLDACEAPHGVIVLDDLHRLQDGVALAFIDLLLRRSSPRWTLAISARHDPPLALARLRAQGEMAEFRQDALRFTPQETRAMAAEFGLDPEAAAALHQRTEGWPAGLRLALNAARSLPGGRRAAPAPGLSERHVFDFLAAEVVDQLRPELRDFLLRCSVLAELEPVRCAAVSGHANAAQLLDEVERLGLFASVVDADSGTLRLHELFRETLAQCLARREPEALPQLRQRAAEHEPDPLRRVALLQQAGALDEAARTLLAHGPRALTEGCLHAVQRLIELFPSGLREASSALQRVAAQVAWSRGDFEAMAVAARRALAAAVQDDDAPARQAAQALLALALTALGRIDDSAAILGPLRREALALGARVTMLVASCRHALEMGSLHRVGPVLDELMDTLETSDRLDLWYQSTPLPRFTGLPGTAAPIARYADGVQRLAGDAPTPLRAATLVSQAWLALWRGRLDEADDLARRAASDLRWTGNPVNVQRMLHQLGAVLHAVRGRCAAALEIAGGPLQRPLPAQGPAPDWPTWQGLFLSARVAAICCDAALLRDCLARMAPLQTSPGARSALVRARPQLSLPGHLAWLEGRADEAIALWQAALQHEEEIDVLGQAAELRVRLAQALLQAGRREDAAAALAPVLARAESEGGPGGALFARQALAVLAQPPAQAALPAAQAAALRQWAALAGVAGAVPAAGPAPVAAVVQAVAGRAAPATVGAAAPQGLAQVQAVGMTAREFEVLARIAAGDSNKLIARAFDLSPHTVKRHVANLLGKLGLASRGQAAAWYHERF